MVIFGARDDSDTSIAAASPAGESEDEDALGVRHVDLGASLVERGSGDEEMVVSDTDDVPGPKKESSESDEGEQLTALVEAEVRDLFHIGCTFAGVKHYSVNHYSALENQRQARVMPFLTCYS